MFQLTNYRRKCLAAVYIFLVDRVVDWADEDGEGVLYPRQRNTSKNIIIEDKTALLSNLKAQMEYVISCGGNIKLDKYFTLHPSIFMNIINEYKGNFNSYEPAILCTFKGNYLFGISYKDLNKITIHAGAMLFKRLTISAACGFSTNSDFNEFGEPAYIGGNIKIYFGKI